MFLIVTFLIYLFALIILYRKIATHTLDQESMSCGGLGFSPFPKNFIFPFCEEWELEITAWVLGLLIDPDLSLFLGEGNGNPLQCSCLENPRDREAWWDSLYRESHCVWGAVYGVTQSQTRLK